LSGGMSSSALLRTPRHDATPAARPCVARAGVSRDPRLSEASTTFWGMGPGREDAAGQLADAPQLIDQLASAMPDATLLAFDADLQLVAGRGPSVEAAEGDVVQRFVGDIIATGSWARVREHYEATLR